MFQHHNTILFTGFPFEINGRKYPSNWLALASEKDLQNAGISPYVLPPEGSARVLRHGNQVPNWDRPAETKDEL